MPLSPGEKLGPYKILAPIGAGGMGEVWKGIVAIKRLKGEHTVRFKQEAHAIAALNHPHICQIHDVGPDYLVMEYVEGNSPQGPLRADEAVKLAVQIASALEEAHGHGKFTTEKMRQLNYQVDGKHDPIRQVAKEFLESAGLGK